MAMDYAFYSEKSNVGFNMKVNEDYILFDEHSFGDNLFCCIADGAGSKEDNFRPSAIASNQVQKVLARLYKKIRSYLPIMYDYSWKSLFYLQTMYL